MTPHELLKAARARIADEARWTQGELARTATGWKCKPTSPRAVRWCGMGTVMAEGSGSWRDAQDALREACLRLFRKSTPGVNDVLGHAAMLRAFDAAIADTAPEEAPHA